jgi:exodeoxyribonuclease V alpha subunit
MRTSASASPAPRLPSCGNWVNDRTHGPQFKAVFLRATPPAGIEGIPRYLGSGMIRGIGPVHAGKLVGAVGEAGLNVIETAPDRLPAP